jgi:hypothetical protein
VQHQGVHYDTGTMFRGPGYTISTRRPALDMSVVPAASSRLSEMTCNANATADRRQLRRTDDVQNTF